MYIITPKRNLLTHWYIKFLGLILVNEISKSIRRNSKVNKILGDGCNTNDIET